MEAPMVIFGDPDEATLAQLQHCIDVPAAYRGVLCGDAHKGYSMPIGGVVAYRGMVSPSGVGYDIACGLKAVKTNLTVNNLTGTRFDSFDLIADDIARTISFGIGRTNARAVDHELFESPTWHDVDGLIHLKRMAAEQLGTVGSGNHFVDILTDEDNAVWVSCHFGSRGLGHKIATGFLNLAAGREFADRPGREEMDAPPTLFADDSAIGQAYIAAMHLAGEYAYAGRNYVIDEVLDILGATAVESVHNHHNFAWYEEHDGERFWVVRKGATPAFPGQCGFVGGSMADISVVIEGIESLASQRALYSAMHGAGRIMSRTKAAGKQKWVRNADGKKVMTRTGGAVTPEMMREAIESFGVTLRGGGADESPFAYRPLAGVIEAHRETVRVLHMVRPIIVVMAGAGEADPYAD